jgi:NifB/MoaA-like Fe-S oxidoreductase
LDATILTGSLFAPVLAPLVERLNARFGTRLRVRAVENRYFGSEIVVAGLMTGSCILAMREHLEGDFLIIPSTALKSDDRIMLDGMRLEELERELSMPVRALDFEGFAAMLSEE